jgi:hypothetical protein
MHRVAYTRSTDESRHGEPQRELRLQQGKRRVSEDPPSWVAHCHRQLDVDGDGVVEEAVRDV